MTSPSTAWQRIARDIAARIMSGETPVGSKIASHQQLVLRHETSLGTVKRAVEHLQDVGVLHGVQGSGVFVQRVPREEDLDFEATAHGRDLVALRGEVASLREQVRSLEDATAGQMADLDRALEKLGGAEGDLREVVGVLQAHLIELYARLGQPYPHGTASDEQRRSSRPTRRRAAEGTA